MTRTAESVFAPSTSTAAGAQTSILPFAAFALVLWLFSLPATASALSPAAEFRNDVQPLLQKYCYDCHGDGASKGSIAFDELDPEDAARKPDLWLKVLKNVRAGLMPPQKKARPSSEEQSTLEMWIKHRAFGIDPANPDPGRVTLRRLNRVEYRNTIRDLTGYDFKVEDELPPDDTGYGFDNIGDVLSLSPMLLEKYMQAAETITAAAVPRADLTMSQETIAGAAFKPAKGTNSGERISFYSEAIVTNRFKASHAGSYKIALDFDVSGQFDYDPGRCRIVFKADQRELLTQELGWQNGKHFHFDFDQTWEAGEHDFSLEVQPLVDLKQKKSLDLKLASVRIVGPAEKEHWVRPKNFDLFFSRDVPETAPLRAEYAREVLARFAKKAFRRPVDPGTIDRLAAIAEGTFNQPGKRFEDGIAQALVPVLASPRFLFRVEHVQPAKDPLAHPSVDEYALASRLSYFLWSTLPDAELIGLADRHELRDQLNAQVKRMLADRRAEAFVQNFTGQWLQTRDVEGIDINAFVVLARDRGEERNLDRRRKRFQELNGIPEEQRSPEQKADFCCGRALTKAFLA